MYQQSLEKAKTQLNLVLYHILSLNIKLEGGRRSLHKKKKKKLEERPTTNVSCNIIFLIEETLDMLKIGSGLS
ncbi:MAG: hypothetical protein AB2693_31790, partial [Candidatus Thiodiazotropha sp.]